MEVKPVETEFRIPPIPPLWQAVANQLRLLILAGELKTGAHLVETELAARLGVSRGPLRQALARLQQEGFVEILPRQGAYVRALTPELVHEKYELRRLFEEYAIRLAVRQYRPADLHQLERWSNKIRQAITTQDLEAFYTSQYAFHRTIVEMARIRTLVELWELVSMSIGALMMVNLYYADCSAPRASSIWESQVAIGVLTSHQELLQVITEGDEAWAVAMIHEHLCQGERAVLRALEAKRSADG